MKKIARALVVVIILTGVFFTGVYASENWLKFTGEEQAKQTETHLEEILDILEDVDKGRKTAEEGKEELEKVVKEKNERIAELEEEIKNNKGNKEYIKHLEKELEEANKTVEKTNEESGKALKKAKDIRDRKGK